MSGRQAEQEKSTRRPTDVCAELDIQPYVLKFWEGEFPQLGRRIGPKRAYGPTEVGIAREIRRLLEEEGLTLGDARDQIAHLFPEGDAAPLPALPFEPRADAAATAAEASSAATSAQDTAAEWSSKLDAALLDAQTARAESLRIAEELALVRVRAEEADALARELAVTREQLDAAGLAVAAAEAEANAAREARDAAAAALAARAEARDGLDGEGSPGIDPVLIDAAVARTREEMAETMSALRRDLDAERTRVIHLQGELHRSWDEAVPLREENAKLTAEIAELRERTDAEREALGAKIAELTAEADALREPAERSVILAAQVADDEAIIARQAAEIETLVADRDAMTAAFETESTAHAAAAAEAARLPGALERVSRLEADLGAAREMNAHLVEESARLGELAARVPGLDEALAAALRRAETAESIAADLPGARAEIERLSGALDAARSDGAATASALAHLHDEHAQLQERAKAGLENLSAFEELLAESEKQREALREKAREEVGAALQQVRRLASGAEKLASALASAAVLPARPDDPAANPEGGNA